MLKTDTALPCRREPRRHRPRRSPPAPSQAGMSSSRRDPRTSRSTRCAISPTAPPGSRATPSPRRPPAGARVTLVSGPVALPDPSAWTWSMSRPPARCRPPSRRPALRHLHRRGGGGGLARGRGRRRQAEEGRRRDTAAGARRKPDILAGIGRRTEGRPRLVVGFGGDERRDDLRQGEAGAEGLRPRRRQ